MSNFQKLASLLLVVAGFNYGQAKEIDKQLQAEIRKLFPGYISVTEIPDKEQKAIERLVNEGKDIPEEVLDKYQVVMPYILGGGTITAFPARFVGGGGLQGKPVGAPEPSDEAFNAAIGFSVEEICQHFIGNYAKKVVPVIKAYAAAAKKGIESIEVDVEFVGYTSLKLTYNVGFFKIKLQE